MHIDFETRSQANLNDVGAYVYVHHPSTRVICMAYAWNDDAVQVSTSVPEMRAVLSMAFNAGHKIAAFNASFERLVVRHLLNHPGIPIEQYVCIAAQARSNAYPGNLDDCARALGLPGKDMEGHALMMRISNAANPPPSLEEMKRLLEYCKHDVVTERAIAALTRPLPPNELDDYYLNERINDRGVAIDRDFCMAAAAYADAERDELNARLKEITLGQIEKVTQAKRIAEYLELSSVRRDVIDDLLETDDALTDHQREVLELRQAGANTTTSKFDKLCRMSLADNRLRGMFLFAGAGQTGRYSSRGAQVHNLARDIPPKYEAMIADIKSGLPPRAFKLIYGDVIYNLSRLVRPALVARGAPNDRGLYSFLIGDFASVEARGLPWLADATDEVAAYERGVDRYIDDARAIFQIADEVSKAQRQIGKVARLSLGFGGGVNAFKAMARNYGVKVDEALAALIVANWRKANPWATQFWNDLTNAAIRAVRHPDTKQRVGKLAYLAHDGTLWCQLPSGRLIAYPQVSLDMVDGPFGPQFELSALKAQWKPAKGQKQWPRVKLWHGLLAENATQAACNDLLRFAMRTVSHDYSIVTHTHDEIVVELIPMFEDEVERFKNRLEVRPPWATDFPLVAEVHQSKRYVK